MLKKILSLGCLSIRVAGLSVPDFKDPIMVKATEADAIVISSPSDFQSIVDDTSGNYVLACDIDLSEIAYSPFSFSGTFNGGGHTIKSPFLISHSNEYESPFLFVNNNGLITNFIFDAKTDSTRFGGVCEANYGSVKKVNYKIGVDDTSVFLSSGYSLCATNTSTGTIIDSRTDLEINCAIYSNRYGSICCENYGRIEDCISEGSLSIISKTKSDGGFHESIVGGMIGYNYNIIGNLYSKIDIYADCGYSSHRYVGVGGVVGSNTYSEEPIKNLFYVGDLCCLGYGGGTAGICGGYDGGGFPVFSHCAVKGSIKAISLPIGSHFEYSDCFGISSNGNADACYVDASLTAPYTPQLSGVAKAFSPSYSNCLFCGTGNTDEISFYSIDCNSLSERTSDYYHSQFADFSDTYWNFDDLDNNNLPQLKYLSFSKGDTEDGFYFDCELFDLTIDNQKYTTSSVYSVVGNHEFQINNHDFSYYESFTIDLKYWNIEDNGIYVNSTTPSFSGGSATLDGNTYESGTEITEIGNHTIIVEGSNNYVKTFNFTIIPTIIGIENNGLYDGSVAPKISGGTLALDGNPYTSGTTIDEPGVHTLVVTGVNGYSNTINFSISLVDSGISDGDNFVDSATYIFSGGVATLDGNSYTSGTEITEIGNHRIVVIGSNEYTKTIDFVINPSIIGLEDGETYDGSVTPSISGGTLALDGNTYESGRIINEPGEHVLTISGVNGYSNTINFSISLVEGGIVDGATYYDEATYTFSGGSATLDGNAYESGTKITEIGNHTIVVTGSTDYEKTISFVIVPTIENIEDGQTYDGSVTPLISGGTITLDGNAYSSGVKITQPGDHVIVISGSNNYSKTINFSISLIDSGIENGDSFVEIARYTFSGGSATLDGDSYTSGTEITEIGNHTIIVTGEGSFSKTIQFVIEPYIEGLLDGETYDGSITPTIRGGTVTLDGEPFESGTTIIDPGEHVILIEGKNDYKKEISFSISLQDDGIVDGGHYEDSASYTFSGGFATLDGKPYTSNTKITEIGNHTLIVSGSTGYKKTVNFVIDPKIKNISNNALYQGSVTPEISGGQLSLDGNSYISGTMINEPGEHSLIISGSNGYSQIIQFSISLIDSGISDGDCFTDYASYTFSGGLVTLDGKKYESGSKITEIGNHTLNISGSRDYNKIINFTIEPSIVGIKNGYVYSGSVTPLINGETLILDGLPYISGTTINQPGSHKIKILGTNNYEKTIYFSVLLSENGITDGGIYYDSVSYKFSGGKGLLDGKEYLSGTKINEIGHHTIKITGSNGFTRTVNFEIKAAEYKIKNEKYKWSIDFSSLNPRTVITIDGREIIGDYIETKVGYHTLNIFNEYGYSETLHFTVEENTSFKNGDVFSEPFIIDDIKGQIFVDDVEVENGYRFDKNGSHTIRIVGTNGYETIYRVTYENPNYIYVLYFAIPTIIIVGFIVFVIVLKRRMI